MIESWQKGSLYEKRPSFMAIPGKQFLVGCAKLWNYLCMILWKCC
jgi:hypothetical protein